MEYKIERRIERKKRERKETKLGTPKGSQTPKSTTCFLLLPWSLYIGIGLDFSVAKTSQISFRIKIKINIQRYLERYRLFNKYSWLIIYDIIK